MGEDLRTIPSEDVQHLSELALDAATGTFEDALKARERAAEHLESTGVLEEGALPNAILCGVVSALHELNGVDRDRVDAKIRYDDKATGFIVGVRSSDVSVV